MGSGGDAPGFVPRVLARGRERPASGARGRECLNEPAKVPPDACANPFASFFSARREPTPAYDTTSGPARSVCQPVSKVTIGLLDRVHCQRQPVSGRNRTSAGAVAHSPMCGWERNFRSGWP